MPATRNITSSILYSLPFIGYQPADISYGEPAVTAANIVKQTMLGPPFRWPWNRFGFDVVLADTQDYVVAAPNFGYLEQAWLAGYKEIAIKTSLAAESAVQRPQSVAVQEQDDDGMTLRVNSVPDKDYVLSGFYQGAPVTMTSLASGWAPIPDSLSYIYDWGFLGMLSMITKDIRQPLFLQKFVSHLLGAQDGITALQRNIFLGEWMAVLTAPQRAQSDLQQGTQARSAT
jgi:hypothetical protein